MAGEHMKPVIMELGGHAPVIVCDDAGQVAQFPPSLHLADPLSIEVGLSGTALSCPGRKTD